ncbi:ATP-binding protein, partial [Planctomycetaceae bacterium]|nr:ATP-binding protein [Planctomycetaceae bacterium]
SMRAHGYTLPTALADLIDNSIAAGCRNVWLQLNWDPTSPWISITDDGNGMSEQELVNAMRLGSRSPREKRDPEDLGRFGLGLKTASFSQARRLTVITKIASGTKSIRRWDLDYLARPDVTGWRLLRSAHDETGHRARILGDRNLPHGTQVLLEIIDRVTGGSSDDASDKDREEHFLWHIDRVRDHLAMVFHRFMSRKRSPLTIHLNDEPISPWDPFLKNHPATQNIGEYSRKLGDHDTPVNVKGFVLPHRDRFDKADDHHAAGGPGGWNDQQGFYLFRGDRLIISGDWLDLRWKKDEHFKLARIAVDIPNSMDHEWQIDVKKSTAAPPPVLRAWLKGIAEEVRKTAKEVYAHRGQRGRRRTTQEGRTPWRTVKRPGGEFAYKIDRKNPVLAPLIDSLSTSQRKELEALLRLVEETVPVQRIWIDTAEQPDGAASPFTGENDEKLREIILLCHAAQTIHHNVDANTAWESLAHFDGFQGVKAQAIIGQLRGEPSDG